LEADAVKMPKGHSGAGKMPEEPSMVAVFGADEDLKNAVQVAVFPREVTLPPNIHLFAFPTGLGHVADRQEAHHFHSFALTLSDGSHMHGHCCTYYHKTALKDEEQTHDGRVAFQPSCLVLLVKQENHATMRQFMRAFFTTIETDLDKEGFVQRHLDAMQPQVEVLLSNGIISVGNQAIKLVPTSSLTVTSRRLEEENEASWGTEMPPADISWEALFTTLSPEVIIHLFTALLCEQQILLLSNSVGKLAEVAEGLLALLYPFKWCHTYIPLLPAAVLDVVQAPFPFLLGAHKQTTNRLPLIRDAAGNVVPFIPESVWQVDLDKDNVRRLHYIVLYILILAHT
jgi:hypothetical protein